MLMDSINSYDGLLAFARVCTWHVLHNRSRSALCLRRCVKIGSTRPLRTAVKEAEDISTCILWRDRGPGGKTTAGHVHEATARGQTRGSDKRLDPFVASREYYAMGATVAMSCPNDKSAFDPHLPNPDRLDLDLRITQPSHAETWQRIYPQPHRHECSLKVVVNPPRKRKHGKISSRSTKCSWKLRTSALRGELLCAAACARSSAAACSSHILIFERNSPSKIT